MGSIKDEVAIIGMGCTQFGERWGQGTEDLAIEAAYEAFEDAGIDKEDIEACWLSTVTAPVVGISGTIAADSLKLVGIFQSRSSRFLNPNPRPLNGRGFFIELTKQVFNPCADVSMNSSQRK